jgi:GNAT superfamily N-acetyltransferase
MQGAALWLPPGVDPDSDRMAELAAGALPEAMLGDAISVMEQMAQYHPDEDCWYLAVIGTDPAHMGTGLGATMMKHCLRQCDEDGKLAYLESSNPKNVSLYERHGFEALGRIQCGSSPTMTPMLREPRQPGLR